MLKLYRVSNWAFRRNIPLIPQVIKQLNRLVFTVVLPPSVQIGEGTFFSYSGLGTILNKDSAMGSNCFIGPHVVLGGKNPLPGAPRLGNNVVIHAGAKLIGKITVGDNVVIAANAVVVSDVEEGTLVGGVPAKVLKRDIDINQYNPLFKR